MTPAQAPVVGTGAGPDGEPLSNAQLLRELGQDEAAIAALRTSGAI